ncbi:hypothetical protein Tco_0735321 [Tanacetum coccineum]
MEMEMVEETAMETTMEMVMGMDEEMVITSEMEMVFHISNCLQKYQVKYATCTLLNSALTWWNSHKRAIGFEAAYAMKWAKLMKLMTEVYCPRNEIQKITTEMVPDEEDKKLKGCARNAKNKRRFDNNPRDNRRQQPAFKRKTLEARMWQELKRQEAMRERGMLGLSPTATSAGCTMKGHVP